MRATPEFRWNMEGDGTPAFTIADEELVRKKKNNGSVIWRWFGFKRSDEQQIHVICRQCHKEVASKKGSTSNLFHHLQQRHKLQYEQCIRLRGIVTPSSAMPSSSSSSRLSTSNQNTLMPLTASLFNPGLPYEKESASWCDITNAVAYHIAKDMVPAATVEQEGFINLLKTIDPRYELPSRDYFAREALPAMYNEVSRRLSDQLAKVTYFALTTETWSSQTCEPYMSLTVNFIEDWKMKTACLQTSYFPQDHTGQHIAEALQDALINWKLDNRGLVAITTDNASNVVKAVELNKWTRMQCFGHRLHLAIGHGMDDNRITQAISLCKRIVSSFSYSWRKRRELSEVQIQLGLPACGLITESATNWGSRQQMIERILEQEGAITKVLSADKKSRHLVPTWQDIEALKAVHKALKPLQDFTDALSGEEYVTLSYIRPVLYLINTNLLAYVEDDTELCKFIKTCIVDYLNGKYADPATSELLDMASFMDPRFRVRYIPIENIDALKQKAVLEAESLLADPTSCKPDPDAPALLESTDPEAGMLPTAKKRKSLASFFMQSSTSDTTLTQREAIEIELSNYLQAASVESDTDPLKWWKEHEVLFPALSHLAKKYLCIPATSSVPQRVFSSSGNVVTCHRASLKPETVDRLVFLNQNL